MRFSTGISPVTVELDVLSDVPGEVGFTLAVLAWVKPTSPMSCSALQPSTAPCGELRRGW